MLKYSAAGRLMPVDEAAPRCSRDQIREVFDTGWTSHQASTADSSSEAPASPRSPRCRCRTDASTVSSLSRREIPRQLYFVHYHGEASGPPRPPRLDAGYQGEDHCPSSSRQSGWTLAMRCRSWDAVRTLRGVLDRSRMSPRQQVPVHHLVALGEGDDGMNVPPPRFRGVPEQRPINTSQ